VADTKDRQYFTRKLEEMFEPERERRLGGFEGACSEVAKYYESLPLEEKKAMKEAVLEWRDRHEWWQTATALIGLLHIEEAVEWLLDIGEQHRAVENGWKADSLTCGVIAALGDIGDSRALPFLRAEAALCGEREPRRCGIAILALSRIDLDEGLRFLPDVVKGDMEYQRTVGPETEDYRQYGYTRYEFDLLLSFHDKVIVSRLASHVRDLGAREKRFVLLAFEHALETAYVFKRNARFTQAEKEQMLREFERGLYVAEV
jgi:hypothetical protein